MRVLLCDELPVVRAGLRALLAAAPDVAVVGDTGDGDEAAELTLELKPDVIVTDVQLAGTSGIELTRYVTTVGAGWRARIIVLSAVASDDLVARSLQAGASAFLVKRQSIDEIIQAIRAVADGQAVVAPEVTGALLDRFVRSAPSSPARPCPEAEGLTRREREVLGLIAEGLANADIAKQLSISEATVKSHVYHLRRKLRVHDRAQMVAFAYRSGLAAAS